MRYWAYFLGKVAACGAISWGLLLGLEALWPNPQAFMLASPPLFAHDLGYTLACCVWFVLSCGLLYLCVWDQQYRCRVCLRRLRMPIQTGSWNRMLQLGRPETEYICTYGHGKLNVAQVQITGAENPEWTPQSDDYWSELTGAGKRAHGDSPGRDE